MTGVTELVDLPDPQVQPLVHPLDVPAARRAFRTHYLIRTCTSPTVAVLAAGALEFVTRAYVGPVIAAAAIIVFGALAARHHEEAAWAFIPRKRQDRGRPVPVWWQLAAGGLVSALLMAAVLLVAFRLAESDVPADVRAYTFGMVVGTAVLVLIDLVRRPQILPGALAVVGGTVATGFVLFDRVAEATSALVAAGLGTMLVLGGVAQVVEHFQRRAKVRQ
ncbi:hypothetical protein [Actinoplanes sp. NPDC051859]|uniref:hypothetical protein n=1 Tax=Actinoplanes sp. NPDC051859 TaxID=3363909 RepID=UPI0037AEF4DB